MKLPGTALLGIAKQWYDNGIVPLPLFHASKRPTILWRSWKERRPSWSTVAHAFITTLYRGIGLFTGPISNNLVVLDFDTLPAYGQWHARTGIDSYSVRTSRGVHVYVYLDNPPATTLSMIGGEIKATGYVVAPPSTHRSGAIYHPLNQIPILRCESITTLGITPILPVKIRSGASSRVTAGSGDTLIDQIKAQMSIVHYLSSYTELYPSSSDGMYLMGICPFHNDTNPSLWVNVELQICGCFSPHCSAHHRTFDVINAYSYLTGIQNGRAVIELGKQLELI